MYVHPKSVNVSAFIFCLRQDIFFCNFFHVERCRGKVGERSLWGPLTPEPFPHLSNFKSMLTFAEPTFHH